MKHSLFLVFVVCFCLKTVAQKHFVLSGKITGAPENTSIKISYVDGSGKQVKDSTLSANGAFSIKGNINGPVRAYLTAGTKFTPIYIEPRQMSLSATFQDFGNFILSGSKTNDEDRALKTQLDIISKDMVMIAQRMNAAGKELQQARKDNKPEKILDSLNERSMAAKREREPIAEKYERSIRRYVSTHPSSIISAVQMGIYTHDWPLDTIKAIYQHFSEYVKNSPAGKLIMQTIIEREKAVGSIAKNFSLVDLNGNPISLSDFKGKYVLLDFWGSWCVPCRAEMPHAVQNFKKYNKSGLEVIAIAALERKDDWKRAIKKDGTDIWHNIMQTTEDAKKPGDIAGLYNIHVFPTKILIDKTGIIIAAYEGGGSEELDKKLAQVFKAN